MTDKEMQALAAQAAGLKVKTWWEKYPGEWWADLDCKRQLNDPPTVWSSLHDDGDAMRLAVHLGLRITPPKYKGYGTTVEPTRHSTAGCTCFRDDVDEQTRYAITHVAAEIGRAALAVSDLAKREGAE